MSLRLATFNVEWFDALFDGKGNLKRDDSWSARHNVTTAMQTDALGAVFQAMDADAVLIVEAPDTKGKKTTEACLAAFAEAYGLRTTAALTGFLNGTQQEIALLFDPAKVSARHDPGGTLDPRRAPPFDGTFDWDVDVDGMADTHVFSKPPLEFVLEAEGLSFRGIGVHAKSKAPHGAESPEDVVRISIANRRKQLAQCIWLRHRVEEHLERDEDIVVLGDFNDGPGLDEYEKLFGRSGVEIVAGLPGEDGTAEEQQLYDPHVHARMDHRQAWSPATARFYNRKTGRYLNALLDFVMVSERMRARAGDSWRIWHPFDDGPCFGDGALRDALLTASDHYPVTVDFETK